MRKLWYQLCDEFVVELFKSESRTSLQMDRDIVELWKKVVTRTDEKEEPTTPQIRAVCSLFSLNSF